MGGGGVLYSLISKKITHILYNYVLLLNFINPRGFPYPCFPSQATWPCSPALQFVSHIWKIKIVLKIYMFGLFENA